jgi:hypothetical protein
MAPRPAKDVTFSANDLADQTMVLDLEPTVKMKRPPIAGEEPTLVLDLTATQVRDLLEDAKTDPKA